MQKKKKANLNIDLAPTHKNEWKMDHRPTCKRQKYKTSRKKMGKPRWPCIGQCLFRDETKMWSVK